MSRVRAPGFTLIELLAVLLIVTLAAAFVVPRLSGHAATEVKSAARTVAAGLRLTRSRAVTDNRAAALELDIAEREFRLPGEARVHKLPEHIALELFTARSELQSEERGAIRFFPDGGSTGGRITLAGGRRRYVVDVDWLTGKVSVLEVPAQEGATP